MRYMFVRLSVLCSCLCLCSVSLERFNNSSLFKHSVTIIYLSSYKSITRIPHVNRPS